MAIPKIEEYAKLMEELHRKAHREGKEYGFLFLKKLKSVQREKHNG